jgi:hypothetical protein
MSKLDNEFGNKQRTVDMKLILNTAQIPTFNKAQGTDIVSRLAPSKDYFALVLKN